MKRRNHLFRAYFLFLLSSICNIAYGQGDTSMSLDLLTTMSLKDLMNIEVITASKKPEFAFDAPVTIGSISKDEIQRSGVTSIPEAMRLIPGLYVVEITNGNYEVYIRGLNALPPSSALYNSSNSITLVMIDNRPVYNYFNGGTFWETLPIDLLDIERIEVVRGASSALYGPNAVAGVIHIITKKVSKEGVSNQTNVQKGSTNTFLTSSSLFYKHNRMSISVSGNFQQRDRSQEDYFLWLNKAYVPRDSIKVYVPFNTPLKDINSKPNAADSYPDPSLAMSKYGYQASMEYQLTKNNYVAFTYGGQKSTVQTAFSDNLATPLTTRNSATQFVMGKVVLNKFCFLLSDNFGTQNIGRGINGYNVDLNNIDINAEYTLDINKTSIKPGLNFRGSTFDDSKHAMVTTDQGFLNGKKNIDNYAASLRVEQIISSKLRTITAFRLDKYDYTSKNYLSYQFTTDYKLSENQLIRVGFSRSYRSPTFYDTYNSQLILSEFNGPTPNQNIKYLAKVTGNKNLSLQQLNLIELGYRIKLTDHLHLDADLFYQVSKDYGVPINIGGKIDSVKSLLVSEQKVTNIDLKTKQTGLTVSCSYVLNNTLFKPYITIQTTKLENATVFRRDTGSYAAPNLTTSYHNTYDTVSNFTPSIFGGFYAMHTFKKKWNLSLSTYFYSNSHYDNLSNSIMRQSNTPAISNVHENGIGKINGKCLVNLKVGYKPIKQLELFISLKNVLNQNSFEYTRTDKIPFMILAGASFSY